MTIKQQLSRSYLIREVQKEQTHQEGGSVLSKTKCRPPFKIYIETTELFEDLL